MASNVAGNWPYASGPLNLRTDNQEGYGFAWAGYDQFDGQVFTPVLVNSKYGTPAPTFEKAGPKSNATDTALMTGENVQTLVEPSFVRGAPLGFASVNREERRRKKAKTVRRLLKALYGW